MTTPVLQELPLNRIRAAEDQPRKTFYQESLEELAASIKERGVLEPIVVRPLKGADNKPTGSYEIVMGERRFRASKLAGKETIPAVVRHYATDEDAAADALLENFQREDLNPVEKGRAIQGLLQMMSVEKVCRALGISETTMRRALDLLELPPAIQRELVTRPGAGQNPFVEGHARALIALNDDPETQAALVNKVKNEKISVATLEQLVDAIKKYPAKKAVFLHVASSVGDQMVKSLGAREERKKPYKAQTAKEHLKRIDTQMGVLNELVDDRIVEFLSLEEMNQLLATITLGSRLLENFACKVREAIENKDYGFREVYTHCPLCGRIELVGSVRCSVCWTILRRCMDCGNYDATWERCAALGGPPIPEADAESPSEKSRSCRCPEYQPKFRPQGIKLNVVNGR
jgi:ParB family chromosome partitioning protein